MAADLAAILSSLDCQAEVFASMRALLRAAKANREGKNIPGLTPEAQRVRSCSIELEKTVPFTEGARHGLYRALDTEPVTV